MLPPVRTISGSSGSYQNSSSLTANAHLTGEPIFPGQAADADRDINPNLAGKLNILLLNGRDGVSESLSMLAEALGRAIHVPRRDGEADFAYAKRLAEVLKSMSPALRQEAERQLNLILRGIRLQVVIEAFLNPAGPQAARIVALMEMAGSKERDLATRTVLTSYRQNGGADVSTDPRVFQGPPTADGMPAAAGLSSDPAGAPDTAAIAVAIEPSDEAVTVVDADDIAHATNADETAAVFEGDVDPDAGLRMFHPETDNIFSRTSEKPATTDSGGSADTHAQKVQDHNHSTGEAIRNTAVASSLREGGVISDARSLQSVLRSAFDQGESSDPVIQAKAAMELLAGSQDTSDGPAERAAPRRDFNPAKPFIDYSRPPPRPAAGGDQFPSLLALKGWNEVPLEAGLPLLPASLEAEAALAAVLAPHAGPEPDFQDAGFQLRGRGIAANDSAKAALEAAEKQLFQNADEAAGLPADRRIDIASRREPTPTEALLAAALQLTQDLRQAIPYVTQPYPLSDERDEERADRSGFRSQGEDSSDEEEDEEAPSQQDADEDRTEIPDQQAEGETGDAIELADPAYDLYQRMAGWN